MGPLTRLRSLSLLQASDFSICLSGIAQLTNLEGLYLYSGIPSGIYGVDRPNFSLLTSHPHLTELVWCGSNGSPTGIMPAATLAALCSIAPLVQLDIRDHDVQAGVEELGGGERWTWAHTFSCMLCLCALDVRWGNQLLA